MSEPETDRSRPDSVAGFITDFLSELPKETKHLKTRLMPGGLFVDEHILPQAVSRYQHWIDQHTDGSVKRSERKCMKRLFGSEDPQLMYLVEGKLCIPGYRIEADLGPNPHVPGVGVFRGSLLDAKDHLHFRDPFLHQLEGVECRLDDHGFRMRLEAGGANYVATPELLQLFAGFIRNSKRETERSPAIVHSVRACIPLFITCLREARSVPRKRPLFIPNRLRRELPRRFLRGRGVVFGADQDGKILACYGDRGRNLFHLIVGELEELRKENRAGKVGKFELSRHGSRIVGSLRHQGRKLLLTTHAVKEVIDLIPHSKSLRGKAKGPYTLYDAVKLITAQLLSAQRAEARDLPRHLSEGKDPKTIYYAAEDLVFIVSDQDSSVAITSRFGRIRKNRKKHSHPRPR